MSQTTCLRAGVIGAGLMGYWHAQTINKAGGQLLAVVDPDFDVGQRLAKKHRAVQIFRDIDQMLDQLKLDVLHVCTPLHTHQMIAERGIDAGLHLLVEKPVTQKCSETARLWKRAAMQGVLLCPVHQFVFQDGVAKAKAWLPRIGELVHLEATFCSAGGMGLTTELQDSVVADILPHPLSLMQEFLPGEILPERWVTVRPRVGELRAMGEMSGVTLSILISMRGRPTDCSFQIIGTEGTLHLDLFHGYAFRESGTVSMAKKVWRPFDLAAKRFGAATMNLGRRVWRGETAYPGLQRLVTSFYQAVRTKAQSPISEQKTLEVSHLRDSLMEKTGVVREPETHHML